MAEIKLRIEQLAQDFADAFVAHIELQSAFGRVERIVLRNVEPAFSEMPRLMSEYLSARAEGADNSRLKALCGVPITIMPNGWYVPIEGDYIFDVERIAEMYGRGGRLEF